MGDHSVTKIDHASHLLLVCFALFPPANTLCRHKAGPQAPTHHHVPQRTESLTELTHTLFLPLLGPTPRTPPLRAPPRQLPLRPLHRGERALLNSQRPQSRRQRLSQRHCLHCRRGCDTRQRARPYAQLKTQAGLLRGRGGPSVQACRCARTPSGRVAEHVRL